MQSLEEQHTGAPHEKLLILLTGDGVASRLVLAFAALIRSYGHCWLAISGEPIYSFLHKVEANRQANQRGCWQLRIHLDIASQDDHGQINSL